MLKACALARYGGRWYICHPYHTPRALPIYRVAAGDRIRGRGKASSGESTGMAAADGLGVTVVQR